MPTVLAARFSLIRRSLGVTGKRVYIVETSQMVTLGDDIVNQIRQRLVSELRPKRIYLFGSRAYGSPHADSDLDICLVVGEDAREVRLGIARRARRILLDLPWPVDVIVRRERDFDDRARFNTTLEATIKNKGVLIRISSAT